MAPTHTEALVGCAVTLAGVFVVSITDVDVALEGHALLIRTLYRLLFMPAVTAVSVNAALVAPEIFV